MSLSKVFFAFLILFTTLQAAEGRYGGNVSKYISGNEVADLFFSPSDSLLFVLTGSGLSYTRWDTLQTDPSWYNFGSGTFQDNLIFQSVAASDSSLYITGYTLKPEGLSGGNIYYKSKGESGFHSYYPQFSDNSSYLRLPYDIHIQNQSQVYISLFAGTILKNRIPSPDTSWKALLLHSTSLQNLQNDNLTLVQQISLIRDSLAHFKDTLHLTDTALFSRVRLFFASETSILHAPSKHAHQIDSLSDSVRLKWLTFRLDTVILKRDTFQFNKPMISWATGLDTLIRSIIPSSLSALLRYNDTLSVRYDSLITELSPGAYPPTGYAYTYSASIDVLNGTGNLLLAGISSDDANLNGLVISTDSGKTFKNVLKLKNGSIPRIKDIFIHFIHPNQDTFQVWALTKEDVILYSGLIPNTLIDSATNTLRYEDSLRQWNTLKSPTGITDLSFFKDTVFVAFGPNYGEVGLSRFYPIDTLSDSSATDTIRVWRERKVDLTNLLEPRLGINTLLALPIDSTRYQLWAGTPDGLYRLRYGAALWDYFEFKRPFEKDHGETYAYPTVIQPGFKSAKIAYHLDKDASITIEVFDFSMRKVKTIIRNQPRYAGFRSDKSQEDRWDGRDENGRAVSPGVYYYKISGGRKNFFGKIVVFGAKDI